jgi:uncharacterized protein YndB with AHSA1/START domain
MTQVSSLPKPIEPVRKSIVVPIPPESAFRLFTDDMVRWWPVGSHSISSVRTASCGIESRLGGEVFEVRDDGVRFKWGEVLVWEPPTRFVMTWHPGRDASMAQEVEVHFAAVPEGTRVDLEHRGWERLHDRAASARTSYDEGWDTVLGKCFADACRDEIEQARSFA